MLSLRWVSARGFRSFKQRAQIQLDAAGLTYITGENRSAPALGANGVGKSTIFEAICWALFGKTSLGLRAGDVVEWEGDSAEVALRFDVDDEQHKLQRTWGPVSLMLNGSPVTQEQLEQVIGYTYETFLFAVYHAQFGEFFSDLTASRQLEVYTQVLGLDLWEELSDTAAAQALEIEKLAQRIEVTLATRRGRLMEKQQALVELEDHELRWWRRHAQELRELQKDRDLLLEGLAKLTAVASKADVQDLELVANETAGVERQAAITLGALQARLQELENLTELPDRCPTCKQKVNRKQVEQHIAAESTTLHEQLTAAAERAATARTKAEEARRNMQTARVAAQAHAVEQERAASFNRAIATVSRQLKTLAARECPHDVPAATQALHQLRAEVEDGGEELAAHQRAVADYRFWVTGFREIRLALIKTSLAQFEVATNSALSALGLSDWSIEYAVEGETKGGKLKRGFTVMVRSPYNEGVVPFAAWSGGEGQRLRLAITMGLSDLIQDFAGSACNVEIFDEPTAHLSADGVSDLLSLLDSRAQQRDTAVLLADHQVLDYGGFARIVEVIKTQHGSTLQ